MHRTPRHRLTIPVLLACLCLLGPSLRATAADREAQLLDLRWRLDGDATAVTFRLSTPVRYRTAVNGMSVAIDLWTVGGDAERAITLESGVVSGITVRRMTPDVVRLEFGVREPARFKIFTRDDLLTVTIFPQRLSAVPVPQNVGYQTMKVATGGGGARVHIVTLDPRAQSLTIQAALGGAVVNATETTSAAAARLDAIVAINGNFYTEAGLPVGLIVIDGRVLSAPFPRRVVFAMDASGRPWIGSTEFTGRLLTDTGATIPISAINRPPRWGGVALYTPEFGPMTPWHALVAIVRDDRLVTFTTGRQPIPHDGYALATAESQQHLLLGLVRGQTMKLDLALEPSNIMQAVQGGPQLVRNGQIYIPYAWEGFGPGFYGGRTARSAIGITHTGKVLLVTVDGRRPRESSGINLPELAELMKTLGARDAMNLDGGGSATLVVGGRVVSALPRGGERMVSGVLVVRRSPDTTP